MDMYHSLLCDSSDTLQRMEFWNFLLPGGFEGIEGKTNLGGPHLIIPRIQQDFNTFFSILPMVQILRLPIGLYIPGCVQESIAQGKLLPLLETFEAASYTGVDILTMVKARNEVAYRGGGFVGSSSVATARSMRQCNAGCPVPPFISEVVLWTSMRQMQKVKGFMECIRSLSSSQRTKFRILYVNQESVI